MSRRSEKNAVDPRGVTMGVELESYTILTPGYRISRELAFPRKGVGEKGERFGRDWSIGTEYNSRPFSTIREGLFLLKAGLRKYSRSLYRTQSRSKKGRQLFLVGGWRDRFAGAHVHMSLKGKTLRKPMADEWVTHLHDHIPLLVAMSANSPVWADQRTPVASNRILKASHLYFRPVVTNGLTSKDLDELVFSKGRKTKPATLEIRVMDSNIPEFVMAAVCILKAISLHWVGGHRPVNQIRHSDYLRGREDAASRGMKSSLCWNGRWVSATDYLDRMVWTLRREFQAMDIPQEMWTVFKVLKKGINGSSLLSTAAELAFQGHPRSWQKILARRYCDAMDHILSGNTILQFAACLNAPLPNVKATWLGRKNLKLL